MEPAGVPHNNNDVALARAFSKRWRKIPMDPEEQAAYRAYKQRYRQLRTEIYWLDIQEKRAMLQRAKAEGFRNLGSWAREKVIMGIGQANRSLKEWDDLENRLRSTEQRLLQQMEVAQEMAHSAHAHRRLRDEATSEVARLRERLKQYEG
jgi:hypothetical protein